jgi:hypothetical protein
MTFTINSITRPGVCDHYVLNVTIGGVARNIRTSKQEVMDYEPGDDLESLALARLRSAVKEANAGNFAQVRTALEGKTFKV